MEILRFGRSATVVLAALLAAVLVVQTPASASSSSIFRTQVQSVKQSASATAANATAAAPCDLHALTPERYDNGTAVYALGGGFLGCPGGLLQVTLHVYVYRNGWLVIDRIGSATKRPGNKLISLTSLLGPVCESGTWHSEVEAQATLANGSPLSGRAVSPPVPMTC